MKKIIQSLIILSFLAANFYGSAFAATVKIATEGAYAPYNFKDAAGNLVGFEVDLAKMLCEKAKLKCEIVEQPWDGIIPSLVAKKYDAIMAGMSITAERQKTISFSRSYSTEPLRFAVLKSNSLAKMDVASKYLSLPKLDSGEKKSIMEIKKAMQGKVVGVQTSTTHEAFMKKYLPEIALKSYDTMDNMLLDLEAKRIDAGFTAISSIKPAMEKNNTIMEVGPSVTGGILGQGVGVGLRKEDTDLRNKFSSAIESMMKDGSLQKLSVKWFGFDTAPRN